MGTHPIFESDFDCLTEMLKRLLVNQTKLFSRAKTTSARPPINPKGKFDDKTEADLEAVKRMPASQKGKLYMEEAPIQKHPGGINPETGERGGPGGVEPTRYGDWERKGRISDF